MSNCSIKFKYKAMATATSELVGFNPCILIWAFNPTTLHGLAITIFYKHIY